MKLLVPLVMVEHSQNVLRHYMQNIMGQNKQYFVLNQVLVFQQKLLQVMRKIHYLHCLKKLASFHSLEKGRNRYGHQYGGTNNDLGGSARLYSSFYITVRWCIS